MDAVQFSVMHMDIHILDSACARTMKQSTYHFHMSAFYAIYKKKFFFKIYLGCKLRKLFSKGRKRDNSK